MSVIRRSECGYSETFWVPESVHLANLLGFTRHACFFARSPQIVATVITVHQVWPLPPPGFIWADEVEDGEEQVRLLHRRVRLGPTCTEYSTGSTPYNYTAH